MIQSIKLILFKSIICLCLLNISCNNESKKEIIKKEKIETFKVRNDSVNMKFLSKAVYDTAIFYNNLPTSNYDYLLNEVRIGQFKSGLKNIFSADKFYKPIPIKEVTWEYNESFFITVWYTPKKNIWKPIDIYKYSKTTVF